MNSKGSKKGTEKAFSLSAFLGALVNTTNSVAQEEKTVKDGETIDFDLVNAAVEKGAAEIENGGSDVSREDTTEDENKFVGCGFFQPNDLDSQKMNGRPYRLWGTYRF